MKSITSLVSLSFCLLAACDGEVNVFAGGGGQGTGNAPPTGGSPPAAGGASSDGGGSSDGGASAQGGASVFGGFSAQGGSSSQGGAPPSDVIDCGEMACDAATQVCCGTQGGVSCIDIGDPCQGVTLSCTSAANCEGTQICCLTGGMGSASSECADECEGGGGPGGGLQLCATSAECPPDIECVDVFGGFTACDPGFGP